MKPGESVWNASRYPAKSEISFRLTQSLVKEKWSQIDSDNLNEISDFAGYREAFLQMHGFAFDEVDYDADVDPDVDMELANE